MNLEKKLIIEYPPQFRDSDVTGLLGIRAYINYFMDMSTTNMYRLGIKGNDVLDDVCDCAWVFSKYKMNVYKQVDYNHPIHIETWIDKIDRVRACHAIKFSVNGEICAEGRLESCLFNLKEQRLAKLIEIDFPENVVCDEKVNVSPFMHTTKKDLDNLEYVYTYNVLYSDIDKSRHMANLRYINLIESSFPIEQYDNAFIKELEIHYLNQCFCGESVRFSRKKTENGYIVIGEKENEKIAVFSKVKF